MTLLRKLSLLVLVAVPSLALAGDRYQGLRPPTAELRVEDGRARVATREETLSLVEGEDPLRVAGAGHAELGIRSLGPERSCRGSGISPSRARSTLPFGSRGSSACVNMRAGSM